MHVVHAQRVDTLDGYLIEGAAWLQSPKKNLTKAGIPMLGRRGGFFYVSAGDHLGVSVQHTQLS